MPSSNSINIQICNKNNSLVETVFGVKEKDGSVSIYRDCQCLQFIANFPKNCGLKPNDEDNDCVLNYIRHHLIWK